MKISKPADTDYNIHRDIIMKHVAADECIIVKDLVLSSITTLTDDWKFDVKHYDKARSYLECVFTCEKVNLNLFVLMVTVLITARQMTVLKQG